MDSLYRRDEDLERSKNQYLIIDAFMGNTRGDDNIEEAELRMALRESSAMYTRTWYEKNIPEYSSRMSFHKYWERVNTVMLINAPAQYQDLQKTIQLSLHQAFLGIGAPLTIDFLNDYTHI